MSSLTYERSHTCRGVHRDSVNCLRFSSDGQYLASGGSDGRVVILNVRSGMSTATIEREGVAVSCVDWTDEGHDQLVAGDTSGFLVTIKSAEVDFQRISCDGFPAHENEIRFVKYNRYFNLLATANDTIVKVWARGDRAESPKYFGRSWVLPRRLHVPEMPDNSSYCSPNITGLEWLPRNHTTSESECLLLIADMFNGVVTWSIGAQVNILSHYQLALPIGSLSLSSSSELYDVHVAVHNLRREFDFYKLRETVASRTLTFKLDPANRSNGPNLILPSVFTNNGRVLVTGSTNGKVQLWDTIKGTLLHVLDHGDSRIILQALSVYYDDSLDTFYIATGMSERNANTVVTIWVTSEVGRNSGSDTPEETGTFVNGVHRHQTGIVMLSFQQAFFVLTCLAGLLVAFIFSIFSKAH